MILLSNQGHPCALPTLPNFYVHNFKAFTFIRTTEPMKYTVFVTAKKNPSAHAQAKACLQGDELKDSVSADKCDRGPPINVNQVFVDRSFQSVLYHLQL